MRSGDVRQESLFTVRELDDFVLAIHPLRSTRGRVSRVPARLDSLFAQPYVDHPERGRPSIAPEKLSRVVLLQVFYSSHYRSTASDDIVTTDGYCTPQRKLIGRADRARFWLGQFIGSIHHVMLRGTAKLDQLLVLATSVYNLVRMRTLGQRRLPFGKPV